MSKILSLLLIGLFSNNLSPDLVAETTTQSQTTFGDAAGVATVQSPANATVTARRLISPEDKPYKKRRWFKQRQKSPEKFKKQQDQKVKKLKTWKQKVFLLRDKAINKELFDLQLKCADYWIDAIGVYKSTDTRIYRSYRFASQEIKGAYQLSQANAATVASIKMPKLAEDTQILGARLNKVKEKQNKLSGDNLIAFKAMLNCAGEYLDFLRKLNPQSDCNSWTKDSLKQALKYINTAEMFAESRASTS